MRRVYVKQQRIFDLQGIRQSRTASGAQAQHGVGAVAVFVQLHGGGGGQCTGFVFAGKRQVRRRVFGDVVATAAHFTPSQRAVVVAVKLQHVVQIAQGDVPADGHI